MKESPTKETKPKPSEPEKIKAAKSETKTAKATKVEKVALIPTADKRPKIGVPQALWLAIANFNIFGLGYWLSGEKKRWLIFVSGGVLLLLAGHLSNASKNPLLWGLLFVALYIGMAVDLWLLLKKKEVTLAPFLQKSAFLLPAAVLLVNMVFYGGFLLYRTAGNNLYQAGLAAYEEQDYYSAFGNWYALSSGYKLSLNPRVVEVQKPLGEVALLIDCILQLEKNEYQDALEAINHFNLLYPDSSKMDVVANIGIDANIMWWKELMNQDQYENGLEKIYAAENNFSVQSRDRREELDAAYSTHYLAWGNYLRLLKNYKNAIAKYEFILLNYSESNEYIDAYEGAALAHLNLAKQLIEQKEYKKAVFQLLKVLDNFSKSDIVGEAEKLLPDVYLDWGRCLVDQSHYLLALEKIALSKDYTSINSKIQLADEEYKQTVILLAKDDGEDGQKVLKEAFSQVQKGEIPTHPSVGLLTEEPGKALGYSLIPAELIADTPGSLRYYVKGSQDTRLVDFCIYEGNYGILRYQRFLEVEVIKIATGKQLTKRTFYGPSPAACPQKIYMGGLVRPQDIFGDHPSAEIIVEWLRKVLR